MKHPPTIADLASFDEIIDVRTPAEFAEDHIPGAINCPVLDNEQRIEVGTLYKQVSPLKPKGRRSLGLRKYCASYPYQFHGSPKSGSL